MTALVKEQTLIDQLATEFALIDGINKTYGFAQNPDNLTNSQLPAVVFVPAGFDADSFAHYNFHKNEISITAIVFVASRQQAGGSLKFLENRAIPFMGKVRTHFQQAAVIKRFLSKGLVKVTEFTGTYGAGGTLLTYNSVEYIGCIFKWKFKEIS